MNTITLHNGEPVSFEGADAVEVFRLATLVTSLELEMQGIPLSRNRSALSVAQEVTGSKSRSRLVQLARVRQMLAVAKSKCDIAEGV